MTADWSMVRAVEGFSKNVFFINTFDPWEMVI